MHAPFPRQPVREITHHTNLFASKAVQEGAVIRRKARDIERFAGMERFMAEIDRRGFRAMENSGQIVIFCNRAPIRWLTPPR